MAAMKKIITLLCMSLLTLCLPAQEKTGVISGTVTDQARKPVEAATVQLLTAGSNVLVKSAVTNKQGVFEIEKLAAGKYLISISAVAFAARSGIAAELTAGKMIVQLPAIQLANSTKELGAVTVTARKPLIEQKIDRTVINVEAAPASVPRLFPISISRTATT